MLQPRLGDQFQRQSGSGDAIGADGFQRPFYWSSAGMLSMGVFTGDQRNYGYGINNLNQVTGQIYNGEVVNAFLWEPPGPFYASRAICRVVFTVSGSRSTNNTVIVGTASLPTCCSFTAMMWSPRRGHARHWNSSWRHLHRCRSNQR